jgi:hypothetical protein
MDRTFKNLDARSPTRDPFRVGQVKGSQAASAQQNDFIEETRVFWQSRTERVLTREDAREIIENMTGFFRVLLEWDRAKRTKHPDPVK